MQHEVSSDTVTTELIRSEKISFTPVITAVIEFLKSIDYQYEAGNLKRIAQLIMKLILKWCALNELKEAEASRMPRNIINGDITVHEVVHEIIPYGQSNNPIRTMISILYRVAPKQFAWQMRNQIDDALVDSLKQADIFPRWTPVDTKDFKCNYYRRLSYSNSRMQYNKALTLISQELHCRNAANLAAYDQHSPGVSECLTLASPLARGATDVNLTKWTAWLLYLFSCSCRQEGQKYPYMAWDRWHVMFGIAEFLTPVQNFQLIYLPSQEQGNFSSLQLVMGLYRVNKQFIDKVKDTIILIRNATQPALQEPEPQQEEIQTLSDEELPPLEERSPEPEPEPRPPQRRMRGIRALLQQP